MMGKTSMQALIEIIFETIEPSERINEYAMFPSGYGDGPVMINVGELASAILNRRNEWMEIEK